ncbi:uncharacterized protein LOC141841982 isoform X3 [Curcuma longa]|uniref:uncharacterized protein LOC141841982 isoform X3 n=1 Tax=Curcuma longa TaxID=136217 RepID=UPI003D9EE5D7
MSQRWAKNKRSFEEDMEPAKAAPLPNFGSVARTVTKILRLRRSAASSAGGATVAAAGSLDAIGKLKLCRDFGDYSGVLFESSGDDVLKPENEKKQQKKDSSREQEALESFVANLFASISAFKAAYAQLQVAQSSYDLDLIQSTDATIVAELRRMSELKRSYFRNQSDGIANSVLQPALAAQLQELRNLSMTYGVTTRKLEDEIELKESEIDALRAELLESDRKVRVLEAKLHPNRSLAALDALHLSGVNPTHFLTVLRYTFKAIRSFVQLMEKEMESAGWDLDAAAGSIQADVLRRGKPGHRTYAFESYVCRRMFSDFSHQSFALSVLEECSTWDRRKFFDEFTQRPGKESGGELREGLPGFGVLRRVRRDGAASVAPTLPLLLVRGRDRAVDLPNQERQPVLRGVHGERDSGGGPGLCRRDRGCRVHCRSRLQGRPNADPVQGLPDIIGASTVMIR